MTDAGEARLLVDLDALAANLGVLRAQAGEAEVAPVVKADAYGLGLLPVARRLHAEGARRFFVARLSEGMALRQALGPSAVVYVLDGCTDASGPGLIEASLTPVLNSLAQVRDWTAQARRLGRALPAALHVDTGMNRLGLRPEEATALAQTSDGLHGVEVELLLTQFACADAPGHSLTKVQADALLGLADAYPAARVSLGASAGTFLGRRFQGELVRPGISLYGAGPFGETDARLRPVATLDAPVLQVRSVRPGETVGYGGHFRAERPMRLAIVGVGYADGVLRAAERQRYAWLSGGERALIGRISMDLLALDATGCDASPGERVELFGPNLRIEKAAVDAGTIPYELLTGVAPRVRRVYQGELA